MKRLMLIAFFTILVIAMASYSLEFWSTGVGSLATFSMVCAAELVKKKTFSRGYKQSEL